MNDKLKTQCKNCKYYNDGKCYYYPPKQVLQLSDIYEDIRHYAHEDRRPSVKENDFCGKFKIDREKK